MIGGMHPWLADPVRAAHRGENPTVLTRMPGGFAVIGLPQFLPGYCLLITDDPDVDRLSDLDDPRRAVYLESMATLAAAVEEVCAAADPAFRRVNIEILGNELPLLHAHIWPRYSWEPPEIVCKPVWRHPQELWKDPIHQLGPQHDDIRQRLTEALRRRMDASA